MTIIAEAPGFLQVFSNGNVKRFAPEIISTCTQSSNIMYQFKDITIDRSKHITARLFLPKTSESSSQFPVLAYFHGGGFCIGSTTWSGYHYFLGDFCIMSKCIVLSVNYRLAPENRLPIAYEDCYSSLKWLNGNKNSEPWLKQANLSYLFLSGDSAGGNIAHHVAIMATLDKNVQVKIKGLLLIHPFFGSQKRTEKELDDKEAGYVSMNDMFWSLCIPKGYDRDYYGCNIEKINLTKEEWRQMPSIIVFVATQDFLKERGLMYVKYLESQGVKDVELVEAEGEHVYHVYHPKSEASRLFQRQMSDFISAHCS